jgi:hypothetical protein
MEYNEKIEAWQAFYEEAKDELATIQATGAADVEKCKQAKTRLIAAPAAKSIKISMHMLGGAKPQTREWKDPTSAQLAGEIPAIISRALKASAMEQAQKIEQIPEPGSRNRFWKKKYDAALARVNYGMLMVTNAKNGQAVPLPPRGKPVPLPVAPITENTSADPNHKPELG